MLMIISIVCLNSTDWHSSLVDTLQQPSLSWFESLQFVNRFCESLIIISRVIFPIFLERLLNCVLWDFQQISEIFKNHHAVALRALKWTCVIDLVIYFSSPSAILLLPHRSTSSKLHRSKHMKQIARNCQHSSFPCWSIREVALDKFIERMWDYSSPTWSGNLSNKQNPA